GVHAHGVDVLDGGDGDDVVLGVTDELKLELLPAEDGLLDEDVGLRGGGQAATGDALEVLLVVRQAGAQATHGEGRADDDRQAQLGDGLVDLLHVVADAGAGGLAADGRDDVLEHLTVLAALDGGDVGADEL